MVIDLTEVELRMIKDALIAQRETHKKHGWNGLAGAVALTLSKIRDAELDNALPRV